MTSKIDFTNSDSGHLFVVNVLIGGVFQYDTL